MELRHLRYFVAVAEELSFRRASQRLNLSGPALSKQIKNLEEEIAVKLLERDTVNVSLTKAGEIFLDDARDLLRHSNHAVERAREAQAGRQGKLRIGSVGMISMEFLPRTLRRFNELYPGIDVEFVEMLPVEQMAALTEKRIDIGFAFGPEVETMAGIDSLRVIHSSFGVAVSSRHAMAGKSQTTLREVRQETLLCLGGSGPSSHREAMCRIFSAASTKPGKARFIEGFDALLTMLAADQGISLLPVVLDLTKQDISIIPLVEPAADLHFHMWAVWRRHAPSDHALQFVSLLDEQLREANAPVPIGHVS